MSEALNQAERVALLTLARETVTRAVAGRRAPSREELGIADLPGLHRAMGGFVTLHKCGELRGCIGEIMPQRSIWEVVSEQAVNASMHDFRFSPVRAEELEQIEIEISAMTPPAQIDGWEQFEVGRHGIILYRGSCSAVFLPQVATEQGWDAETTLTHLSMKAGLSPNAWREGCRFEVFEAQVFGEKE